MPSAYGQDLSNQDVSEKQVATTPASQPDSLHEKAQPVAEAIEKGAVPATVIKAAAPLPKLPTSSADKAKGKLNLPENYRGIVRIEVASRARDYATPWAAGSYSNASGTGFMVGEGLFMTNAHVVADAERIYISQFADSRKIPARVRHVAHDADLALIEIEDTSTFKDIKPVEFHFELPQLEDTVRVVGYPIGGTRLSVTRGIVSRIETNTYAHPRNSAHLTVQVDAAINPGNSGGPAFKDDKVVGVAFQGISSANSTGYIIPAPVIERFLKDVQDGAYDNYVDLGVSFFPLQNQSMRAHFKLANDGIGVLVGDVVSKGSCDGALERGDIVVAINALPVDSSAMIELAGERVELSELAERSFKGDKVEFDIIRKGEKMKKTATLLPLPNKHVIGLSFDEEPRFITYGGLLFQPLNLNVISAHKFPSVNILLEIDEFINRAGDSDKEDIVVLTKVLPDEVNARFSDYGRAVVTKVNGVELKGLSHLYELLYPKEGMPADDFVVMELADAPRPLVFERKAMEDANKRISAKYKVTSPARLQTKP